MRRVWPIAATTVLVVAMAGCAQPGQTQQEPPFAPGGADAPDFSTLTPLPTGYLDEDTHETYMPQTVPVWDERSKVEAVKAGEEAMRLFARPGLDHDTWWDDLAPLMNDMARKDYAYVQPESVPASKITGSGKLLDEDSAYVANVQVRTDAGTYVVVLNRSDGDSPWTIARYLPPEKG